MVIEDLPGGVLQGYSAALNLNLRWEDDNSSGTTRQRDNVSSPWTTNGRPV